MRNPVPRTKNLAPAAPVQYLNSAAKQFHSLTVSREFWLAFVESLVLTSTSSWKLATTMEGERRECLDAYYLQPPPPYPNILPPSTAASQQSLETASVIFDSAYNSDHTPEETEDGAVGGQATAVAAAAAVTAAASNKKKGEGKENNITVTLADRDLWKEFYKVGNEMIVTKPGR